MEPKILSDLKKNQFFRIVALTGRGEVAKRLADMGFTPGTRAQVCRTAMFKGPMLIEIRGYQLSLRKSEASLVSISLEKDEN